MFIAADVTSPDERHTDAGGNVQIAWLRSEPGLNSTDTIGPDPCRVFAEPGRR
jgi:hypothetical protein